MKPLNKFISAAFALSLILLACAKWFPGFLNDSEAINQLPINKKIIVPSADSAKKPATIRLLLPGYKQQPTYIAALKKINGDVSLSHTLVRSSIRFSYKQNTGLLALTKKLAIEGSSIRLLIIIPLADSAIMQRTINPNGNTEDVALNNNKLIPQENTETGSPVYTHKKMAGTAYEGTLNTAFSKTVANANNSLSTNETIPTTDLPLFSSVKPDKGSDSYSYAYLYEETEQLKEYAARNGANTDYAIMINLGIKSAKKRFFVVDLSSNTIIKLGVVSVSGKENEPSAEKKYLTQTASMTALLGMYKTDKNLKNGAATAYRFSGLMDNYSNGRKSLLLQASEDIPYDEIGLPLLNTDGSLSVSPRFLSEVGTMIDGSTKPVLLLVFDPSADKQPLFSAVQKNK